MRELRWSVLVGLAAFLAVTLAPAKGATPAPPPGETPAPTSAPTPANYVPNRDYWAYNEKKPGRDYYALNKKYGRLGYELDPPFTEKTCGDCLFKVNNKTLVLERMPGCDPSTCAGTLELSNETLSDDGVNKMLFLGIAPNTFDGLHEVTHLDLSGQPVQNNPPGLWDDFDNRGAGDVGVEINLRKTLYNCYPPYDPCSKTQDLCWSGFPRITFLMSALIPAGDTCVHVNDCGYKQHTCTVWRNSVGMASLGGECKHHCQNFDISGKGIRDLPFLPNGLVDSIDALNILKIDNDVKLKPSRMFSTRNLMGKRLFVLKQNGQSWAFAGKAWFTVPHKHNDVDMTMFVN
uniref:Uncharacterized protein n=1 Tax=Hemiselmis andersenii TaxID=464988 RepID=A0A6T8LKB2_HEMAN|mmetsp:Transcript_18138/g.42002  ORF Transcript_18138/g.42002 Transcript_18138/m.42002 type:complete len:347 (+) Transcript_18138:83-1123(+)|eukprot:CAMPEP_0114141028 /NCGR_PEP_ID=MMETSP0043_2-20121206/17698_1 /TAXON_ID=464988 /ORGANISM="Hemiselmis andersenii, Strain CCMP644" /LENGTH=346 /DNA_ID=CAMNT_0001235159 /DNA_START=80 /DNA_END=1120 /DNA_ORIENTATION=-